MVNIYQEKTDYLVTIIATISMDSSFVASMQKLNIRETPEERDAREAEEDRLADQIYEGSCIVNKAKTPEERDAREAEEDRLADEYRLMNEPYKLIMESDDEDREDREDREDNYDPYEWNEYAGTEHERGTTLDEMVYWHGLKSDDEGDDEGDDEDDEEDEDEGEEYPDFPDDDESFYTDSDSDEEDWLTDN